MVFNIQGMKRMMKASQVGTPMLIKLVILITGTPCLQLSIYDEQIKVATSWTSRKQTCSTIRIILSSYDTVRPTTCLADILMKGLTHNKFSLLHKLTISWSKRPSERTCTLCQTCTVLFLLCNVYL